MESCPIQGKVRNYLSIGGPQMGVSDVPHCFGDNELCNSINFVARNLAYYPIVQDILGPTGYFRDPRHMDLYLKYSEFLPYLNNELGTDEAMASNKERFSSLHGLMAVMFTEDTMVYPKESEWFQQLEASDMVTAQPLEDSQFYSEDLIGLRTLNEAGAVQFISIEGDHLQFSQSDIDDTFIPFLLS